MNQTQGGELSNALTGALKDYLRKKYPFHADRTFKPDEWASIGRKYKRMRVVTSVFMLVQVIGFPMVYAMLLYPIYLQLYKMITSTGNQFFLSTSGIFLISGILIAFCTINPVTTLMQRIVLWKSYEDVAYYHNVNEGYENDRSFSLITRYLMIPTVISLLMGITTFIIAGKDHYTIKNYFSGLPTVHYYKDIVKVIQYKRLPDKQRGATVVPHYRVYFKDKSSWKTNFYFDGIEDAIPFITLLQEHGIKVESGDIDTD